MNTIPSLTPELLGRSLRYASPEIILLEGVPDKPGSLTPAGTVTCLVATQGSPLLAQIRSAAYRKDHAELQRHGTTIARAPERLFESLSDIPVLTEIRYSGRILVQGLFTNVTRQVAAASVHYSGGPLHDADFLAVDYFHPPSIPDTQHMVIVSMPSLTELEQAILTRVPDAHSEVFVFMPGLSSPAAIPPRGDAVFANVLDGAVDEAGEGLEADEEGEADERAPEAEENKERTVGQEALEKIDRPEAQSEGGYINAALLTALQQQDFSKLDETASARTLLKIRMQLRKRR